MPEGIGRNAFQFIFRQAQVLQGSAEAFKVAHGNPIAERAQTQRTQVADVVHLFDGDVPHFLPYQTNRLQRVAEAAEDLLRFQIESVLGQDQSFQKIEFVEQVFRQRAQVVVTQVQALQRRFQAAEGLGFDFG